MTHTTLDTTYDYGKSLKKANIPEHQIDALVARDQQTTQLILNTLDEKFATKNDLEKFATKIDLKHEIQDLKHEIETKFATKHDLEKFATKSDLKHEIQDLKHEIETKFATKIDLKHGFELVDKKFELVDEKFESLNTKFDTKFESLNSRLTLMIWIIGITGFITSSLQVLKIFGH